MSGCATAGPQSALASAGWPSVACETAAVDLPGAGPLLRLSTGWSRSSSGPARRRSDRADGERRRDSRRARPTWATWPGRGDRPERAPIPEVVDLGAARGGPARSRRAPAALRRRDQACVVRGRDGYRDHRFCWPGAPSARRAAGPMGGHGLSNGRRSQSSSVTRCASSSPSLRWPPAGRPRDGAPGAVKSIIISRGRRPWSSWSAPSRRSAGNTGWREMVG